MSNLNQLRNLRKKLNLVFSPETAFPGSPVYPPSSGHCAVVAAIIYREFGGTLVSTKINDQSHWFNRLEINGRLHDIDLTGDQFSIQLKEIQIKPANLLYINTRVRNFEELTQETLNRSDLLLSRLRERGWTGYVSKE